MITLDPAQRRFFMDDVRVQAVRRHRQKGKDFTTAAKAVLHAMETGQSWYIVSLTQRQADATFAKCKEWAERYRRASVRFVPANLSTANTTPSSITGSPSAAASCCCPTAGASCRCPAATPTRSRVSPAT